MKYLFFSGSGELPENETKNSPTPKTFVHESSADDVTTFLPQTTYLAETEEFDYYDFLSTVEPSTAAEDDVTARSTSKNDVTSDNDVTARLELTSESDDTSFYDVTTDGSVASGRNVTNRQPETAHDVTSVKSDRYYDVTEGLTAKPEAATEFVENFAEVTSLNETGLITCESSFEPDDSIYLVKLGELPLLSAIKSIKKSTLLTIFLSAIKKIEYLKQHIYSIS